MALGRVGQLDDVEEAITSLLCFLDYLSWVAYLGEMLIIGSPE